MRKLENKPENQKISRKQTGKGEILLKTGKQEYGLSSSLNF